MTGHRDDIPEILSITDMGVISSAGGGCAPISSSSHGHGQTDGGHPGGGIPGHYRIGLNGLLIPPEDPQALADAVLRLLDDKAYADRMGQKAQELIAGKYTADQMAEQVYEVYLKVFSSKIKLVV